MVVSRFGVSFYIVAFTLTLSLCPTVSKSLSQGQVSQELICCRNTTVETLVRAGESRLPSWATESVASYILKGLG